MSAEPRGAEEHREPHALGGLCPRCVHVRTLRSSRGRTFLMCRRALREGGFAKYPPQPLARCAGFEEAPPGPVPTRRPVRDG